MLILLSISLVAVGGITESLQNRYIKECKEQQELAIGAAKIYFSLNSGITSVELNVLNGDGGGVDYFKDDKKIDKLDLDNDIITFDASGYKYNGAVVGVSCG